MGIMHREVINRRKDTTIIGSIVFLSLMIGLAKLIGNFKINHFKLESITDPIMIVLTILILYLEIKKCKVSYKYSVIANQLIIHKIKVNEQQTLENIKLNNIISLKKEKNSFLRHFRNITSKKYICSLVPKAVYCCVYKKDNDYKRFYFQPSGKLVEKLEKVL
ncbi:hypothetical protein [Clostridium tarantellae]|uniref:Uncharacterized protein n=1 Tax=Clostridium tarantellae TaxID=39493 RepID=A0A6I1MPZ6_9CLOT|nr:hypothetical protein [Clostridium tarantellae]MPQ44548.1 hypothetical protein [Clostridium tarantellae]